MDSGIFDLAWCQGYSGSQLSFIENGVVAYQCGRNVKTISLSGKHGGFAFKDAAIGPVAFHKLNKHIAIAEYTQQPKIFIYVYPTYSEIAVLKEGADLEFQTIAFSESDYFASISGIPNFKLVLWNYVEQKKLATVDITKDPVKSLSFNTANWRQICMMTDSCITLWNVEQCNAKFLMLSHIIRLPPENLSEYGLMNQQFESLPADTDEKSTKKNSKYIINVPDSAVAGLSGEEVQHLDVIKDSTRRVQPVSMAWLPTGDFYVGCEGAELFKVDTDLMKVHILYHPSSTPLDKSSQESNFDHSQSESLTFDEPLDAILKPGSLQCMEVNQNGLYVAGKDGVIRLLDVAGGNIALKEEIAVNCPVSSLAFGPNYQILAWGSPDGTIQYYTCGYVKSISTLLAVHNGNFVGVGGLPLGSDCAVSLREDGILQVWKIADGTFVSELNIGEWAEALVCSRLAQYAVAGTSSGNLCFIDLTNTQKPRLIVKQRLFRQPIKHMVFNNDAGTLLFVASNVSSIFLIDARATMGFNVLGYLTVSGKTQSLATYVGNHNTSLLVACNNNPQIYGSNLLYKFVISDDMIKDISQHYKSSMCDIKEESCRYLKMGLRHAICNLALGEGDIVYAISASTKRLLTFTLPDQDKKLRKIDLLLTPFADYPGHHLPGGNILMSPHMKWLLTYGPDGCIKIRTCTALERTAVFTPFEYRDGGVRTVAFSDDHLYILCIGFDGSISCCHWNRFKGKSGSGLGAKLKRDRDMDFANRENTRLATFQDYMPSYGGHRKASEIELERKISIEHDKQAAQDRDEIYVSPPPSPSVNATWLEQREIDLLRQEGKHFASVKHELRSHIRDIRRTIQNMMAQNNDLPDIEKLSRNEFDLDLEEQNRLQAEGEAEIHKVREDIEYGNLSKLYLREKIKEQCWDKMKVKGRAIQAFNSALEVSNFPLRERSSELLKMIKTVSTRRKIEMREAEARKQIAEVPPKLSMRQEEEVDLEDTDESSVDYFALSGSLGAQCGGANELFYSQFDLHCREQKIGQIILIEDAIHQIKEAFNKEFDEVYSKKEQEITKVKEKNRRISKIIDYLGLDEEIPEPAMSVAEKPELLFDVNESEIKAEKYLTPEQRKQQEEEKRLEEERRAREKGDNARERALEMMMGGVLEIKKEDELKKDVPKPTFMLTKKEEEFSEEEQKQYKEYLKKVQDLNEEREKFKKQLESELRKLQVTIQENLQAFDDTLNLLFQRKIKIMMVVFQEELKILRLRYAMLIHEEIEVYEKDLIHILEHKKQLKHQTAEAVAEAKKILENLRNEYDALQAEDKYLDRSFKKEFTDVSAVLVDALYKHFKKRPRTHKYRQGESASGKTLNPFSDRPSSALQLAQLKSQISAGLDDLDKPQNTPDSLDISVWERMCKLRRAKLDSETMLKTKANALAEVQSFLHKRHSEDEKLKAEIDQINHKFAKLKEDEQRFILNLEVQLLLKQGQIEVDCGPFIHDFRDSVLIHRSVVEDLNSTIKQLGESKIASMVESKDFRKGIIQLEWEHKKMSMEMEDLESKMKDIQFIKVTREIQAFLQEDDYEAKKQAEIATLEQTISMLKKQHERNMAKKKQTLRNLCKGAKNKETSNEKLYTELLDLNVVVNERRHIEEVNGGYRDDGGVKKRYQEIKQRRKLVDLAKAQAQEIAVLRAEVERLRMRTFPALVQVER